MLFQPYIVIYQNVQGHSAVAWPPLCTKSKCFISSQNFFTLWPGKLHMISDRDIYDMSRRMQLMYHGSSTVSAPKAIKKFTDNWGRHKLQR